MNKITYLVIFIIFLNGCDNYLETEPYSFVTVDNYYKTSRDIETALSGIYATLIANRIQGSGNRSTFAAEMEMMLSGGTDELIARDGFTDIRYAPFGINTYNPTSAMLNDNWFFLFAGINRANYLLDKLDQAEMDADRKVEVSGEAHFLRGMFYMYLAMMYGGVPVSTSFEQAPQAPRQPLSDVYSQVISDFQFAYENLPDRARIQGMANKWSAAGFLSKVYAYLASCKINNVGADLNLDLNSFNWVNSQEIYSELLDITEDIISSSKYILTEKYDNLFRETTAHWQYEECLFVIEGSSDPIPAYNYFVWIYWMTPTGNTSKYGGGYGWFRPLGEVYYLYDSIDFRGQHCIGGTLTENSSKEVIEGVEYYVPLAANPNENSNWYSVTKFRYKDPAVKTITKSMSEGNYPLLRYADILLLRAEALFQNGDEYQARTLLTQVRNRSVIDGGDVSQLDSIYYRADFMEELLEERSRELCFESHRRIDLIRLNQFSEALEKLDPNLGRWNANVPELQASWAPNKIWFPIPQSQRDLNKKLVQNPGY